MKHSSILQFFKNGPSREGRKAMLFWSGIFSLIFTLLHLLTAIFFGGSLLPSGVWLDVLLAEAVCLLCELARCGLGWLALEKWGKHFLTGTALTLIFAIPSIWIGGGFSQMDGVQAWISTGLRIWLPALLSSAVLTVLCLFGGVYPALLYGSVCQVLPKLLPPEQATNHLALLPNCLLPVLFLIALDVELTPEEPKKEETTESVKKSPLRSMGKWIILGTALVLLFTFSWGLLPIRPTAVATGSMTPQLQVGDLVVTSVFTDSVEVGDIIQFHRDDMTVIHRVVELTRVNGEVVYITRGDANKSNDGGYVRMQDVEGKVLFSIPYLGWITLWLHAEPTS